MTRQHRRKSRQSPTIQSHWFLCTPRAAYPAQQPQRLMIRLLVVRAHDLVRVRVHKMREAVQASGVNEPQVSNDRYDAFYQRPNQRICNVFEQIHGQLRDVADSSGEL